MCFFWKNGSLEGRSYSNFADGKLAYEKYFANNFKTGTWKFYNQNGTLREQKIFESNKTPWDSNDDYAHNEFYYNDQLTYTLDLVAGRSTNLTIIDKGNYEKLMALEMPNGQKLFIQNCASCHKPKNDYVGPKMKGVTDKRTEEWLMKMITNGDELIKSGDKDAVLLYNKYNKISHPSFERLSQNEVIEIIDYLKTL